MDHSFSLKIVVTCLKSAKPSRQISVNAGEIQPQCNGDSGCISLAQPNFSLSALLYTSFPGNPQCNGKSGGISLAQWSFLCRHRYTPAFPNQAVRPLYVHDNTTGSGDLHRGTSQHAQFATHLPSVSSCPSSTINLPDQVLQYTWVTISPHFRRNTSFVPRKHA